jgi:hypothetical protein
MDADTERGVLTTRPVKFKGRYLFVNVDAPKGSLAVEVLDENAKPIEGLSLADCTAISTDSTIEQVIWKSGKDPHGALGLSSVAGRAVRFRFQLSNGRLYSFWVSPDKSGASYGYVAAGGPGYPGPIDTAGRAAYGN